MVLSRKNHMCRCIKFCKRRAWKPLSTLQPLSLIWALVENFNRDFNICYSHARAILQHVYVWHCMTKILATHMYTCTHIHPCGISNLCGVDGDVSIEGSQEASEINITGPPPILMHMSETQHGDKLRLNSSLFVSLSYCCLPQVFTCAGCTMWLLGVFIWHHVTTNLDRPRPLVVSSVESLDFSTISLEPTKLRFWHSQQIQQLLNTETLIRYLNSILELHYLSRFTYVVCCKWRKSTFFVLW